MGIRKVGSQKCGKGLTRNRFGRCIKKNLRQALDQAVYEWILFPNCWDKTKRINTEKEKGNVQSAVPWNPAGPPPPGPCTTTYVTPDYVICDYVV
tara:strand:+ start:263 stop:547 length:285 start_codon:yes stop_codon:yes gene_type:complete